MGADPLPWWTAGRVWDHPSGRSRWSSVSGRSRLSRPLVAVVPGVRHPLGSGVLARTEGTVGQAGRSSHTLVARASPGAVSQIGAWDPAVEYWYVRWGNDPLGPVVRCATCRPTAPRETRSTCSRSWSAPSNATSSASSTSPSSTSRAAPSPPSRRSSAGVTRSLARSRPATTCRWPRRPASSCPSASASSRPRRASCARGTWASPGCRACRST